MKKWNTRVSILLVLAILLLSSPLVYAKQTRSNLLPNAPTNLVANEDI